jgi:hypothetical protein
MVENPKPSRLVIAVLAGAVMYVVAVLLRSAIYRHVFLADWFPPIDATVVYLIAMLAGVVAMLLYGGRNLLASALAAGFGEIAHTLLKHYEIPIRGSGSISLSDFISPGFLGALPAALLGAAGAALWLCIVHTSNGRAAE